MRPRTLVTLLAFLCSSAALAQRTDENVTAQSDDAFGRSVGNESIGIYNSDEVRGFSPVDAGNARIEGLYFDRQTSPAERLIEGSSIRVGVAAQSYPFPAPTGIVDYDLRRVGDARVVSSVLLYGPFDGASLQIDAQLPIVANVFGIGLGASLDHSGYEWGGANDGHSFAVMPRWRPTPNIELRPFFSQLAFRDEEAQPRMFTRDGRMPPKIRRERYYGQPWAQNHGKTYTYGLIGEARFGEWLTRLGLFESAYTPDLEVADFFTDIDAERHAQETLVVFPDSRYGSKSGELRAQRSFDEGTRRHTMFFALRGRLQQRRYGGEQEIDIGAVQLGVGRPVAKPEFEFGAQSHDEVRQHTLGAGYELKWKDRGELSFGLQKTHYTKSGDTPEGPLPQSRAEPLLKNVTGTVYATERLAIYASYTQGLEESPVAPSNAVNRNVAAPALETKQYDAGVRIGLLEHVKLIAGVFNVEKPYFDLDTAGFFRELGTVRHRGVELSVSGSPIERLTMVVGTRFLDAQVSGPLVDAGIIGSRPIASARNYSVGSIDYAFAESGFSLDTTVESISRAVANTANTVEVPGRVVVHVGGRYKFKLFGKPATLRAQVGNIFDRYGWSVNRGGSYVYNQPRRFSLYLATDL
ncbi:MAG TPA: TonB-dependent receptor [Steroidobacteraceae bacterium]|nr:TonB-dependent receptor [Steroidobacteraceae bacterium]